MQALACAHNKRSQMVRQIVSLGSFQRQCDGSFSHCEAHIGRGCAHNMKVCALGSDLMWGQHFLSYNSWSSRSPSRAHNHCVFTDGRLTGGETSMMRYIVKLVMLVTKRDRWESTSQRASNVLLAEFTYVPSDSNV